MKTFISLIGKPNSHKSTALNNFCKNNGGIKLLYKIKDGKLVCRINGSVVFIETSSPQEQEGLKTLKEIIDYFEKLANVFNIQDFIIICAFSIHERSSKGKIDQYTKYIEKQGYTYKSIPKTLSKDDIDEDLKSKL